MYIISNRMLLFIIYICDNNIKILFFDYIYIYIY